MTFKNVRNPPHFRRSARRGCAATELGIALAKAQRRTGGSDLHVLFRKRVRLKSCEFIDRRKKRWASAQGASTHPAHPAHPNLLGWVERSDPYRRRILSQLGAAVRYPTIPGNAAHEFTSTVSERSSQITSSKIRPVSSSVRGKTPGLATSSPRYALRATRGIGHIMEHESRQGRGESPVCTALPVGSKGR